MMRLTSRSIPLLTGLLLLVQLVAPWRGWAIMLLGLGAAWGFSWLWARSLQRGLTLRREMRFGWAQVGDRLEERFTLENRGWAPALWVEVVDHSDMPGYTVGRATGVGGFPAKQQWQTEGRCTQRGLFTLGPTTLRTGDPLGLYTVELFYPASATLMVTPPILPLPQIEVAPGGRAGDGRPQPYTLERALTSATIREYVAGDPMSWIHWPSSARHGELNVRLFDGAPVGDWWIVLDAAASVQAGEGMASTQEHGIVLAASLADRGLRLGRNVGLMAHGGEPIWFPPRHDAEQRLRILRALALLTPGELALEELVERARGALGRYASVVLITPDVSGDWMHRLPVMRRRGIVPTVLLLDPHTFGDPRRATHVSAQLSALDIAHHVITRDSLDQPGLMPGEQGNWEWRVSGTGRAIAVRRPAEVPWKELG